MLDFLRIRTRPGRVKGTFEIVPTFIVKRSEDLMIRGASFYGIWDEAKGLWSTNEFDVQRLVDAELYSYYEKVKDSLAGDVVIRTMEDFSTKSWSEYKLYLKQVGESHHTLDDKIVFRNTPVVKTDYISRRLNYDLAPGDISAYEELISTLYEPEEREKLEWAIGSIISGQSRYIQKFIVLYGEAGSGKSTILNIIQSMFEGYYVTFDAKALGSSNNTFATESFRTNPLVAIQHDGDLSRIEDNTKLNSIVSHEIMPMHEKYKATYDARCNAFLFMGTNKPVKITDAKSGLIRRLIDVNPSGNKLKPRRYNAIMKQVGFELGAIAQHCLDVFEELGQDYYSTYRPVSMMFHTDPFFNYVEFYYERFLKDDEVSLKRAYTMYNEYCSEANIDNKLQRHKFRDELKSYFREFEERAYVNGEIVRSYYRGFISDKFAYNKGEKQEEVKDDIPDWLDLTEQESIFDAECSECPAQYGNEKELPLFKWNSVRTKLSDLRTDQLHYVKVPENHIVIDFDLTDEKGEKSYSMNLKAASEWPPTYAETSKGGSGIHLSYIYDGDPSKLAIRYADKIEVKTFPGGASLRRKLTKCNDIPIAHISSGLPMKEEKNKMINSDSVKNERHLRRLIEKALAKEIHPGTKPNVDYITMILDKAYESDVTYDVSDMKQSILIFACGSTHQSDYCIKQIPKMKFQSKDHIEPKESPEDSQIVFFDCEVFPNLLMINWKFEGPDNPVFSVTNPKPEWFELFFKYKLIGFNCRNYDNHILYGAYTGMSNQEIFDLSKGIVEGKPGHKFGQAYNISYTDVYDFSSKKQSLKKFEIELGIHHQELNFRWDQPVPEDKWPIVAQYCNNDVIATEAVFNARKGDWDARLILAKLAGMTPNDTTNSLTTKIIFKGNRNPQSSFNYRDLGGPEYDPNDPDFTTVPGTDPEYTRFYKGQPVFPGYKFDNGKSIYKGIETGEGGYAKGKPGMYGKTKVYDIAGMHPASIIAERLFGDYTDGFAQLVNIRLHIKHKDYDPIRNMFDGMLAEYLTSDANAKALSSALKIAINSVYGLTSARFDNPFRDIRNKDNIVAKRGALFMINLIHEVERRGYTVIHVKTDSIKVIDYDQEIEDFIMWYGKLYGYTFEIESVYDRICLVNDAVYIAKYGDDGQEHKHDGWTATGAEFAHPYIFKKLFSHEEIKFEDLCETKSATTSLYLDMNESLGEEQHDYIFVGKVGLFVPIKPGRGGGLLMREKDGKYYSVTGTKGYRWLEAETVILENREGDVDFEYFNAISDAAAEHIMKYGDITTFAPSCENCSNRLECNCNA